MTRMARMEEEKLRFIFYPCNPRDLRSKKSVWSRRSPAKAEGYCSLPGRLVSP
jgi:hypothetical protein